MITERDPEFLINTQDVASIVEKMRGIPYCKPIMIDRLIRRTLYKVPNQEDDSPEKIKWIRIMDGDIECGDKLPRCTITYKDKMKNMTEEEKAVLKVDNYDDALHLFDLLHYEKTSYQENKRSKFVCVLDHIKYIIKFDIWPKIEDVTFVSVSTISSANEDSINGFVDAMGLAKLNIWDQPRVDVDRVYEEKYGRPGRLIPEITFDFDFSPK